MSETAKANEYIYERAHSWAWKFALNVEVEGHPPLSDHETEFIEEIAHLAATSIEKYWPHIDASIDEKMALRICKVVNDSHASYEKPGLAEYVRELIRRTVEVMHRWESE
jgi:hypothetical protein